MTGMLTSAALLVLLSACASPTPSSPSTAGQGGAVEQARRTKTVVFAVTSAVEGFGIMAGTTTTGGWATANELHTAGLITADFSTRKPIGRLAERVPTLDDGSITMLPDGRMRVVYNIRQDATWHDGTRVTAHDLVFSARINGDPGLPNPSRDILPLLDSYDAPDDRTFVINFKKPYYLAGSMGPRFFWPHPRHILEGPYNHYIETKNTDDIVNLPHWTSQFISNGPFKLVSFDPGAELGFQSYNGYFLGRPKIDSLRIRLFADQQTLVSNLLAGAVDVWAEDSINAELGAQLEQRWQASGGGTVIVMEISHRFLSPQVRPNIQIEPANLDVKVRAALYHALDRDTLTEAMQAGHKEFAAWAILPPNDLNYEAVKDGMRPFAYDPEKAKAVLRDSGWTPGSDGILRNSVDGRRFRNTITATIGTNRELPAFADYWRRVGLEVEELIVPAAQTRNLEYRALYSGWEASASSAGDGILGRLEGPAASPQNRWSGNRGGYEDPRAEALIDRYRSSLSERDQFEAMKAIGEFVAAELPFLVIYRNVNSIGFRAGVKAYDDHTGGGNGGRPYGTFTRNAHLWDVQ